MTGDALQGFVTPTPMTPMMIRSWSGLTVELGSAHRPTYQPPWLRAVHCRAEIIWALLGMR